MKHLGISYVAPERIDGPARVNTVCGRIVLATDNVSHELVEISRLIGEEVCPDCIAGWVEARLEHAE